MATVEELDAAHVQAKWVTLRDANPSLLAWASSNPYAKGLFRYISLAHGTIAEQVALEELSLERLLVLCDGQDWLASVSSCEPAPEAGFARLPSYTPPALQDVNPRIEIWVAKSKSQVSALHYLDLLGLVDCETWARGRLLSTPLGDGQTAHQLLNDWRKAGSREHVDVWEQTDFSAAIRKHFEQPVAEYLAEFFLATDTRVRHHILNER